MLTADSITDAQIRELLVLELSKPSPRDLHAVAECRAALGVFQEIRSVCRLRCAQRLNARNG
jgi:hypothetical protein